MASDENAAKKAAYKAYLKVLKDISSKLENSYDYLKGAEAAFAAGGYISEGETLDQGVLKKSYDTIEANIDLVNSTIEKTRYIIEELD